MVVQKPSSVRNCRSFRDCNIPNKANSRTSEVVVQTTQKLFYFDRYVAKPKLLCQKSCVPLTRAAVFIKEDFHPGYRDLGYQASASSHMNTSRFFTEKRITRRGNRASPVDQGCPLSRLCQFYVDSHCCFPHRFR